MCPASNKGSITLKNMVWCFSSSEQNRARVDGNLPFSMHRSRNGLPVGCRWANARRLALFVHRTRCPPPVFFVAFPILTVRYFRPPRTSRATNRRLAAISALKSAATHWISGPPVRRDRVRT